MEARDEEIELSEDNLYDDGDEDDDIDVRENGEEDKREESDEGDESNEEAAILSYRFTVDLKTNGTIKGIDYLQRSKA